MRKLSHSMALAAASLAASLPNQSAVILEEEEYHPRLQGIDHQSHVDLKNGLMRRLLTCNEEIRAWRLNRVADKDELARLKELRKTLDQTLSKVRLRIQAVREGKANYDHDLYQQWYGVFATH